MNMKKNQIQKMKKDAVERIIPHFANYELLSKDPKIFVKGEGSYLYDIEGKKYLDTFASLLTTIIGHGRAEIADIAAKQMRELEFFPNYVDTFTVPLVNLANKLAEIAPGELGVSFFVNSGSEANETAIKMAKQYHWERGEKKRWKIIARRYSYHATTLGGTSATGIPWFREPFEPLMPGFLFAMSAQCFHCELKCDPKTCGLLCLREMEKLIEWEKPETVAAIIMDPIPGSNVGYPLPPPGYLEGVRALCDKYGILLIFDEVQTGFGKTGKWFACEHWNVTPDIMTLGKGLTGGYLPLGVTMTTPEVYRVFRKSGSELRSGSTYGGHTTACATTLANIEIIERENLVQKAARMGSYVKTKLEKMQKQFAIVGDIRGIGLLWAVELLADRKTRKPFDPKLKIGNAIREYCWNHGMILRNNGDILVIAPALTISKEEVDFMINLITRSLAHVCGKKTPE
jgi:putrescine---pyruvate transaminase